LALAVAPRKENIFPHSSPAGRHSGVIKLLVSGDNIKNQYNLWNFPLFGSIIENLFHAENQII